MNVRSPKIPRIRRGRHMLLIILGFFGVVIGVNVTMATLASKSWTGLVVEEHLRRQPADRNGKGQGRPGTSGHLAGRAR